ncbi:MAG: histidine kinase dimerization/phospho-acceptor domain-containing protein [Actinomycetota bacterium]
MATAEVDLIVSAVPTPVLVADYTPIIERFDGMSYMAVRQLLETDDSVFQETLKLPDPIAASPEWVRLYGAPDSTRPPNFEERSFTKGAYPELYATLIQQFTAPFSGTTSIIREHTAPTLVGDVMVRSHWKALGDESEPTWDRIVIVDFDVTELRNAQETLEGLLEVKNRLMNSKDELIASVSHEIRTPLSSIRERRERLRAETSPGRPGVKSVLTDP